jgi:hypothetical protein
MAGKVRLSYRKHLIERTLTLFVASLLWPLGQDIIAEENNGSLAKEPARDWYLLESFSTWLVVNHKCEPIICIEGESELAWYLLAWNGGLTTEHNYVSSKNSNDLKLPPKILSAEGYNVIGEGVAL